MYEYSCMSNAKCPHRTTTESAYCCSIARRSESSARSIIYLHIKGGPKPSCLLFFRGDFKSNFRLSGIFVPVGQFFPARSSNRAAEVGVGVKWSGPRRLGKMAARSDAARQTPPGHPGLQHITVRPPSDATPLRYCRFSAQPTAATLFQPAIGSKRTSFGNNGGLQWPAHVHHTDAL